MESAARSARNRIPDDVRARIVTLALDEAELSPRELAVRFTDVERYFVSEASVYRLLKALDLITSPAFIVMKAALATFPPAYPLSAKTRSMKGNDRRETA